MSRGPLSGGAVEVKVGGNGVVLTDPAPDDHLPVRPHRRVVAALLRDNQGADNSSEPMSSLVLIPSVLRSCSHENAPDVVGPKLPVNLATSSSAPNTPLTEKVPLVDTVHPAENAYRPRNPGLESVPNFLNLFGRAPRGG